MIPGGISWALEGEGAALSPGGDLKKSFVWKLTRVRHVPRGLRVAAPESCLRLPMGEEINPFGGDI